MAIKVNEDLTMMMDVRIPAMEMSFMEDTEGSEDEASLSSLVVPGRIGIGRLPTPANSQEVSVS